MSEYVARCSSMPDLEAYGRTASEAATFLRWEIEKKVGLPAMTMTPVGKLTTTYVATFRTGQTRFIEVDRVR